MKNEITLKIKCSINEFEDILKNKGFKLIDKFEMEDLFYISKSIDVKEMLPREILKSYILIRKITQYKSNDFSKKHDIVKLTYKEKEIANNGDIIRQINCDCEIKAQKHGEELLENIGYKKIMTIKEKGIVYSKNGFDIEIKDIINGDKLIEIETNKEFTTIDKLKQKIVELNLPIDKRDFFVKKAEIELKKILGDLK